MAIKPSKSAFLYLLLMWNILYLSSYTIYRILPIVQMGERSWPLLFFLVDALALVIAVFWLFILVSDYEKKKQISYEWLMLLLLLIYPLFTVYTTYSDLTMKLCKKWEKESCIQYIPPPNLKVVKFTWSKETLK